MQYQGGKSRISKQIATIIERNKESNCDTLVSLFCVALVQSKVKSIFLTRFVMTSIPI